MGTYYAIYAEVRVGNKWYNISLLMRNEDGEVRVQPIMSGQSVMHDAAEELEGDCFMLHCQCGKYKQHPHGSEILPMQVLFSFLPSF